MLHFENRTGIGIIAHRGSSAEVGTYSQDITWLIACFKKTSKQKQQCFFKPDLNQTQSLIISQNIKDIGQNFSAYEES